MKKLLGLLVCLGLCLGMLCGCQGAVSYTHLGKYHLDGHRACGVRLSPQETRALQGKCPVCGKRLTVGVEHRVEDLACRQPGSSRENRKPFAKLVPLATVLSRCV